MDDLEVAWRSKNSFPAFPLTTLSTKTLTTACSLTLVHKQWRVFERFTVPRNQTYFEKLNYKFTLSPAIDYAFCCGLFSFLLVLYNYFISHKKGLVVLFRENYTLVMRYF